MTSLLFLLLFLHFLNSSTMLSAADIRSGESRLPLPLLVFQDHHPGIGINFYKHVDDGQLDDLTTINPPPMDYYVYNAASDPVVPMAKKHTTIEKGLRILYQVGVS